MICRGQSGRYHPLDIPDSDQQRLDAVPTAQLQVYSSKRRLGRTIGGVDREFLNGITAARAHLNDFSYGPLPGAYWTWMSACWDRMRVAKDV
jgi:hypothetical protein